MKLFKIIIFLVIVSTLASIFMLSSCEKEQSVGNAGLKIIDSDDMTVEDFNFENNNKVFNIMITKNRFYPSYIQVNEGDYVLLKIRSPEENSGFELKDFNINTRVPKDLEVKVGFLADKKGTFQFDCGNYCSDIKVYEELTDEEEIVGTRLIKGKFVVS